MFHHLNIRVYVLHPHLRFTQKTFETLISIKRKCDLEMQNDDYRKRCVVATRVERWENDSMLCELELPQMQRSVDLAAAARDREDLRAERTAAAAWRAQESTAEARVHAVLHAEAAQLHTK